MHLYKVTGPHTLPCPPPVCSVGRYERHQRDQAGVCKQARDLAHPPDVLLSVRRAEAKVLHDRRTDGADTAGFHVGLDFSVNSSPRATSICMY